MAFRQKSDELEKVICVFVCARSPESNSGLIFTTKLRKDLEAALKAKSDELTKVISVASRFVCAFFRDVCAHMCVALLGTASRGV